MSGHTRDFMAVEDVVEVILRLAGNIQSGALTTNELIHIVSGKGPYTMQAVWDSVQAVTVDLPPYPHVPKPLVDLPELKLPSMSSAKMMRLTGHTPQISLQVGIANLVRSCRANSLGKVSA